MKLDIIIPAHYGGYMESYSTRLYERVEVASYEEAMKWLNLFHKKEEFIDYDEFQVYYDGEHIGNIDKEGFKERCIVIPASVMEVLLKNARPFRG